MRLKRYEDGLLIHGDCLKWMKHMKRKGRKVDLVFGSPPYEDARTYGIDFKMKGQDWVDWMVELTHAALAICDGLVAWVVEGMTRKFEWSATPVLLMADLVRGGVTLRKPPIYRRDGIPGSGGPDWLANKYEFIVCCTNGGKLPWSDNTAMGHEPRFGPGGSMSHRGRDGKRVKGVRVGGSKRTREGKEHIPYKEIEKANPGNIVYCGANAPMGVGNENEAPFPVKLSTFFVRSFCCPGGTVYDPFAGSGTTIESVILFDRKWMATDVRASQMSLCKRRIDQARTKRGFGV